MSQVTVNCSGWIDRDDPQTIISYKIYVKSQDPLSGENVTYLLYSGTDNTQSVYLSSFAGKSVELFVNASDEFGASAFAGQRFEFTLCVSFIHNKVFQQTNIILVVLNKVFETCF